MQRQGSIFTERQFLLRKAHSSPLQRTWSLHKREKLRPCVVKMNHLTLKYPHETQGLWKSEDLIKITVKVLSWGQPAAANTAASSVCLCTDSNIKIDPVRTDLESNNLKCTIRRVLDSITMLQAIISPSLIHVTRSVCKIEQYLGVLRIFGC